MRECVSMLLPNVIIAMWSRVSPRVPAHVCRRGAAPPPRHGLSRSVPPASVSQGTLGLLLFPSSLREPLWGAVKAEPAKFEAECVLPTKRIDGPLLMRREHLTCALIELMQITHTPSRSNGVFHRPPEAFYRIEVVTAVGR